MGNHYGKILFGFIIYTALVYYLSSMFALKGFDMIYSKVYSSHHEDHHRPKFRINSSRQLAYKSKEDVNWILTHPIYKKFYLKPPARKKSVTIVLIISSAPKRLQRRNMIRETWWTQCVPTGSVIPECIFITDYQGPNDKYFHQVHEEEIKYKDLYFQLVKGGVTFGNRFLYHLLFAEITYNYDYFLRVDDDQFVCLDRLLKELPMPMEKYFHWGWVHPQVGIRRPEECIIMLSHDVVHTFIEQDPNKMLCSTLADQMIAQWLTDLNIKDLLRHDPRIHHTPPIRDVPEIKETLDICHKYMSLHGSYQNDSTVLWKHRGDGTYNVTGTLKSNSIPHPIQTPFRWNMFGNTWRYEPKLCIEDPTWDTSALGGNQPSFSGRE